MRLCRLQCAAATRSTIRFRAARTRSASWHTHTHTRARDSYRHLRGEMIHDAVSLLVTSVARPSTPRSGEETGKKSGKYVAARESELDYGLSRRRRRRVALLYRNLRRARARAYTPNETFALNGRTIITDIYDGRARDSTCMLSRRYRNISRERARPRVPRFFVFPRDQRALHRFEHGVHLTAMRRSLLNKTLRPRTRGRNLSFEHGGPDRVVPRREHNRVAFTFGARL